MAEFVPVEPFDIVIFGATGDLTLRKLIPALYHRDRDDQLPSSARIIAVARTKLGTEDYRVLVHGAFQEFHGKETFSEEVWARFSKRITYVTLDACDPSADWQNVEHCLESRGDITRVFYFALPPSTYGDVARNLVAHGLVTPLSRVIVEKPIGHDLKSAQEINRGLGEIFPEEAIFRIDHYLGKETVQNLIVLRFANALLEPVWTHNTIDHVQITVSESIGVDGRAGYYNKAGALRDMVQNHLLQLLCLVAMEPPSKLTAEAMRQEKIKVLRALRPIALEDVKAKTVRGQYKGGAMEGVAVPSYMDELPDSIGQSDTETFTAVKAEIDNWRWSGVPFYLRTGKRMEGRFSEIIIQFKGVPHSIFSDLVEYPAPNRLILRLQPDESVKLELTTKVPGPGGLHLRSVPLNLSFADTFTLRYPDSYERLLMDTIRGNLSLFMHRDEVEAAWAWVDGIQNAWVETTMGCDLYPAGTNGPMSAALLMDRDGRTWLDAAE